MSLKQRVRLELDDHDPVDVTFDGRDLRAWEVKHRRSSITEPMSISLLSWCGWHAAQRLGLLNGSHDTWEKFDALCSSVDGMNDDEVDVGADPPKPAKSKRATPKAPSAG